MSTMSGYESLMGAHESKGVYTIINGLKTFALDQGEGPVIFCIHGVPTSSFLWRKVATAVENSGVRMLAIDLPGLGFSDRPEDFDYSFSNLAKFCNRYLDERSIHKIHLVIHDIGTPIGLYLASQNSSRIESITVLNSMLDLEHFVKPLPMRPFETPVLGEAELAMFTPLTFPLFMKTAGLKHTRAMSHDEMSVYIHFLKKEDGGKSFLKIMRHFEKSPAFTRACYEAFQNTSYPVQLIWGMSDPLLRYDERGVEFENARPGLQVTKVDAKHFLQEEQFKIIAEKILEFVHAPGTNLSR